MARDIRYSTSADGTQIAYSVQGSGPTLVICPYFFENHSYDENVGGWEALMGALEAGRHVVRYDMRGSGLSQREGCEITPEGNVSDLESVVAAARVEQFDLMAWTMSGPVAIEFAARHAEQVRRLVLYAAFARPTDAMPEEAIRGLAALCRANWPLASQTFSDMSLRQETTEVGIAQATELRGTISGEVLATSLEMAREVVEEARSLTMPTLVLHRTEDSVIPFAAAQRLASLIPNARLAPLKGSINWPGLGDTQAIADAVVAFLDEGRTAAEPEAEPEAPVGGFRTILFSDIVGHTSMMQRLGDEAGRQVLREHERITRDALRAHGGSEVKAMGDGFMASFSSATRAIECAIGLQRAFEEHGVSGQPIRVRVGLNAGEPIAEDDDLFGTAVILAARIAAQADGGEILVSEGVRQIVAGKQFLFSDRGATALRGFEDPVHVYEVNWRS
jgi:class 3 adenylate cyclase/pimeloyl-ACP methyl ester carboxylesterase